MNEPRFKNEGQEPVLEPNLRTMGPLTRLLQMVAADAEIVPGTTPTFPCCLCGALLPAPSSYLGTVEAHRRWHDGLARLLEAKG